MALEAHGTGTALGDPVEVGAAVNALCTSGTEVLCSSLKANMGHLEAVAGGAGVVALLFLPLSTGNVAPNVQLQDLNSHLTTLVRDAPFKIPIHGPTPSFHLPLGRLNSFGASGTIAHGAFGCSVGSQ